MWVGECGGHSIMAVWYLTRSPRLRNGVLVSYLVIGQCKLPRYASMCRRRTCGSVGVRLNRSMISLQWRECCDTFELIIRHFHTVQPEIQSHPNLEQGRDLLHCLIDEHKESPGLRKCDPHTTLSRQRDLLVHNYPSNHAEPAHPFANTIGFLKFTQY